MQRALAFDDFARSADAAGEMGPADLEVGALLLARDAYPHLDVARELARLDDLAEPLTALRLAELGADDAAQVIARHVYVTTGFRGNEQDYGDPRNSYLNEVLERRTGIPITLALVLLSICRRVGVAAHGVSFPGHFLVRFERAQGRPLLVDPFAGGQQLGRADLGRILRRVGGSAAQLQTRHLEAASPRAVLVRMLTNLKAAHVARGDLAAALVTAARIVTLSPREPSAVRDRGILQAQLGATEGARADLRRYLELSEHASDADQVKQVLARIEGRRAVLN